MIQAVLLGVGLLTTVAQPVPAVVEEPGVGQSAEEGQAQALARYNERRDQTPKTAEAQWRLALWCEQNGLEAEAEVHLTNVVRLDPGRDAAWKKLGYRKHHGKWMSDDQINDEAEQTKADRAWTKTLDHWHKYIHGGKHQIEAETALAEITDRRAVPAVYREFGVGSEADQAIAVQILGQIDDRKATKALASLAVYGASPQVRRIATETLRQRDEADYFGLLTRLLVDPLRYEVRPVGGPGSPGVLFVEGERYNVKRYYAPPPPPRFHVQPGDMISYDELGLPVIIRPGPIVQSSGVIPGPQPLRLQRQAMTRLSLTQSAQEARRGAVAAQGQLEGDIARIDSVNAARKSFNEHILTVLRGATGTDHGDDPQAWKDAMANAKGYQSTKRPKPTIDELVPLAYVPRFGQLSFISQTVPDH